MQLIGNENTYTQLKMSIRSAMLENRPLPHTLLKGAAGCGKTSTAKFITTITQGSFVVVSAEKIKTKRDLIELRRQLDNTGYDRYGNKIGRIVPTVVFIDEIHTMPVSGQECLGIMMEEWYIPIDYKEANVIPGNKLNMQGNIRLSPQFTVVGATTNDGLLTKPFKDRFKLHFIFDTYSLMESVQIVKVHADRLNKNENKKFIEISPEALIEIAKRGRGVPRIIVGLLERCRDYAILSESSTVRKIETDIVFDMLGIDNTGLGPVDIKLLKTLNNIIDPIGLDNLTVILNESKQVIQDSIEPYLIQRGLINRKSRGREITIAGREYLVSNGHIKLEDNQWFDVPTDHERTL